MSVLQAEEEANNADIEGIYMEMSEGQINTAGELPSIDIETRSDVFGLT